MTELLMTYGEEMYLVCELGSEPLTRPRTVSAGQGLSKWQRNPANINENLPSSRIDCLPIYNYSSQTTGNGEAHHNRNLLYLRWGLTVPWEFWVWEFAVTIHPKSKRLAVPICLFWNSVFCSSYNCISYKLLYIWSLAAYFETQLTKP